MKNTLSLPLNTSPEQAARLRALQQAFAQVCNALAPTVAQTRVWNRVALHHMAYRQLREQFPDLGSQMVCNAIYAVSRISRTVYQHPASPFNASRLRVGPLPVLRFVDTLPVYFDRHTLSIKDGKLSMFALGGRMHFNLSLRPKDEAAFHKEKLLEIVMSRNADGAFELRFLFQRPDENETVDQTADPADLPTGVIAIPEYVQVEEIE